MFRVGSRLSGVYETVPLSVIKRASSLLLMVAPLTTLAISPWFNFDPINLIKILVLTCFTYMTLGLFLPYIKQFFLSVGLLTTLLLTGFIVSLLSALLFNGTDKAQQFWGIFGRGTGILSYISLALLFLLSSFLASPDFNKKVIISLFVTTSIMVAYCFIQILGRDPIDWSAFFPFGTLGNVNFLSGFMGFALVSVLVVFLSPSLSSTTRIFLGLLMAAGLFALYKSNSTQGLVALSVGTATFLLIKSFWISRRVFVFASVLYFTGIISLAAGLFNKGPLREFIYQFTVLFRADYMHAGLEMMFRSPWNGVGLDSYDDWYRSVRGSVSALRTSLNRTANSAHNITLDLGAGGGFPLFFSYLALTTLVFFSILVGLKRGMQKDYFFMAAAMSWVAYQVQAAVSINQIGVGVWGWMLGGLIVGRARSVRDTLFVKDTIGSKSLKKSRGTFAEKGPNTPPPLSVICSVLTLTIGFLLSFPSLKTDADYLQATKTGNLELILEVSKRPSANAFLLSRSAASLYSGGLNKETEEVVQILTTRFPRNIFARTVQYESFSNTVEEKAKVANIIKGIDPILGMCYEPDAPEGIRRLIETLPSSQKYELARGWGILPFGRSVSGENFQWSQVDQMTLTAKISAFCTSS